MRKQLLLIVNSLLILAPLGNVLAVEIPPIEASAEMVRISNELQLEVFINDVSTKLIATTRRNPDGTLAMPGDQLRNVGLIPSETADPEGWVALNALAGVTFTYDEASQSIRFTAGDAQRVAKSLRISPVKDIPEAQRGFGALINYTLFGNLQSDDFQSFPTYDGTSGYFDGRLFSPVGTLTQSLIGRLTQDQEFPGFTRLDTRWSYSDPGTMITYSAGDIISSGLSWTRPVRLGGLQVQRNFALRPDLLTMPLPDLSGSAAVPSTVDIFINNTRVYSDTITGGPFHVDGLPIVAGPGTARVVVRDALGRESVQDVAFYASPQLLAKGLLDFSGEVGYARRYYGTASWDYDERLMGSGTARYGLTDWFTLEGHSEGGAALVNGGIGAVVGFGPYGVGSLSVAGSRFEDRIGYQIGGAFQVQYGGWTAYLRTQRTFGPYDDIASVTASWGPDLTTNGSAPILVSARPPKALDQLSLSIPLKFDLSSINLSITRLETDDRQRSTLLGASYSRHIMGRSTGFVTVYKDFENNGSYGIFAGVSFPIGDTHAVSTGVQSGQSGTTLTVDAMRPQGAAVGDYGWRVRALEGSTTQHAAAVGYRTPYTLLEASVQQIGKQPQATVQAEGAVALMDGEVFLSNRIDDAFAVVDAGAPGVEVFSENRSVGTTGRSGKILVPSLRSWEVNEIAIDPTNLPLSAEIPKTRDKVVPAQKGGVSIFFKIDTGEASALVVLRRPDGSFVEAGSLARLEGQEEPIIIGYDGQTYLKGLAVNNVLVVEGQDGSTCRAEFPFTPRADALNTIPDAVCQ